MPSENTEQRKLAAIMFTDMVGSTQLKQDLGDREALALIQRHHAVVRKILVQFNDGEEISTAGDSFFLVFGNPSDGVKFALVLHAELRRLAGETGRPVFDRIGIHVGEVFIEERAGADKPKDLHGIQVDTCSRVMALAKASQILMTRSVFDNARQVLRGQDLPGVGPLAWLNHGSYLLKGVEEPLEICEVGEASLGPLTPPSTSEKARRHASVDEEPVLGWRPALEQFVPGTQWVLERKLGEGGFGEVWLGRHDRLKERRVFKFCFRADRVRSLKREVTLFRLLKEKVGQHPNIVGIQETSFEAPPFYIVMDYAEALDLRAWCQAQGGIEKVPLATRLEIVAQVAGALQAAHEAGVIHRDVKPSNILVSNPKSEIRNPKLEVRLTDFGIGQVVSQEALAGMTKMGFTQTMLSPGSSSQTGTQLFMAPELLAGNPASTRSDIYSLGVVLYQLLVGDFKHPLTTDWGKRISDPLLREDLEKCFAGNPEERFAEAAQLASNLRSLDKRRAELAGREKAALRRRLARRTAVSFAVVAALFLLAWFAFKQGEGKEAPLIKLALLPLANFSGDVAQQYFADEMTDDLIGKLGQISALQVIARAATMQFKNPTNSVSEIARQLKVDAVVRGTVKREGDRVKIEVAQINGRSDHQLWSTKFERDVRDVFALQNEVALAIARKMKVKVTPEEQARLAKARQVNPEALDLYYRGKASQRSSSATTSETPSGDAKNQEAIRLYERAVEMDKNFAPAWAALAGAYIDRLYWHEPEDREGLVNKAQPALLRAIGLDPNLALAYESHGRLLWGPAMNFQNEDAHEQFQLALQKNPSAVGALTYMSFIYGHTGFFDESVAKSEQVRALNPRSRLHFPTRAFSHLWKGEYQQSISVWEEWGKLGGADLSMHGAHWALVLFGLGRTNEARAKVEEFLNKFPTDGPGELTAMKAVLFAASGNEAEALAQIRIAEKKSATYFGERHHTTYLIACAYARLNKTPEALQWLKQTAETGFPCFPYFKDDPNLNSLRTEPGFKAFLQKQETDWRTRRNLWFKADKADLAGREKGASRRGPVRTMAVSFAVVAAVFFLAWFAFKQRETSKEQIH